MFIGKLTLDDLIQELQQIKTDNPEAGTLPIRIAYQESWPLRTTVANIVGPAPKGQPISTREDGCDKDGVPPGGYKIDGCTCKCHSEGAPWCTTCCDDYDEPEDDSSNSNGNDEQVVWIVANSGAPYNESPYASRDLWDN
jgi:hypothetical protein